MKGRFYFERIAPHAVAGACNHRCAACGSARVYGTLCTYKLPVSFCTDFRRPHTHGWCLDCNARAVCH